MCRLPRCRSQMGLLELGRIHLYQVLGCPQGTWNSCEPSNVERIGNLHADPSLQISKVRSLDLDDWSDGQLQSMREGGNKAARLLYEPPDLSDDLRAEG